LLFLEKMLSSQYVSYEVPFGDSASGKDGRFKEKELAVMNEKIALTLVAVILSAGLAQAKPHPAQTTPFNLSVVAPVTAISNGDANAQAFASTLLPKAAALTTRNLSTTLTISGYTLLKIDPAKIDLVTESDVRVYFAGEGAGYSNSVGYNGAGPGVGAGAKLAFLNSSSPVPLASGDYVDLGKFDAGTNLDFFVIADGANHLDYKSPDNLDQVSSTDTAANLDGLQHVFAYAVKDSPYLLFSFEDLVGGGDRDYNDVVLVADIGNSNIRRFFGAPEPSLLLALGSFSAVLMTVTGRRRA